MGAVESQITSLTIVYSTVYSDTGQRKHQSSASLAFVQGPVNSRHKWPVTRKMFPLDDVIMSSKLLHGFYIADIATFFSPFATNRESSRCQIWYGTTGHKNDNMWCARDGEVGSMITLGFQWLFFCGKKISALEKQSCFSCPVPYFESLKTCFLFLKKKENMKYAVSLASLYVSRWHW